MLVVLGVVDMCQLLLSTLSKGMKFQKRYFMSNYHWKTMIIHFPQLKIMPILDCHLKIYRGDFLENLYHKKIIYKWLSNSNRRKCWEWFFWQSSQYIELTFWRIDNYYKKFIFNWLSNYIWRNCRELFLLR